MSGVRLKEMEASEMVDVVHFLFEDDLNVSSSELMEARSSVRTTIYESLYGEKYKYEYKPPKKENQANGDPFGSDSFNDLAPFDPSEPPKPTKPYTPPTDFNEESSLPFGETLDAPMG
jgi:hypothetical protein